MELSELGHGGALSSRNNEGIHALQLFRFSYLHALHPQSSKRCHSTFIRRENRKRELESA